MCSNYFSLLSSAYSTAVPPSQQAAYYLHRLIKQAFTTPSITPLLIVAYGIPLGTTSIYIYCRLFQIDVQFDIALPSFRPSTVSLTTNHSSDSLNSTAAAAAAAHLTSSTASQLISKYLNETNDPLTSGPFNQLENRISRHSKLFRSAQSIDLKSTKQFSTLELNLQSVGNLASHNSSAPNDADLDEIIEDRLNDLIGTSYEDQCWSLPSVVAWHEWLINLPNLCILVVSCNLFLSHSKQGL